MRLNILNLVLLPFLTLALATTPHDKIVHRATGPTCTTFKVPITASAQNQVINVAANADLSQGIGGILNSVLSQLETGLGSILGLLITQGGTYQINMKYCVPEVTVASRSRTLQFLSHPATMTLAYWDFPIRPETYSWVDYFSKLGYPTLSIDRLGAGLSDHPDPITTVQANLQVAIHHAIIQKARSGTLPNTGNVQFNKIIYVGGSYGSILGNQQAKQYPNDVDSYILTGYTNDYSLLVPIFSIQTIAAPAAIVHPSNSAGLPVGYLTSTGTIGRQYLYSAPADYDQDVFNYDNDNRGTITLGEAITANAGNVVATGFRGSVKLIIGKQDSVFCGTGVDSQAGLVRAGDCGTGSSSIPSHSSSYFPNARNFSYSIIPNTGHVSILHKSVQSSFASAAEFLQSNGF